MSKNIDSIQNEELHGLERYFGGNHLSQGSLYSSDCWLCTLTFTQEASFPVLISCKFREEYILQ